MRALGFLCLVLLPTTFAAPTLKGKLPTYYHAIEVGTVLEYEVRGAPGGPAVNSTMALTITKVETKGTGLLLSFKRSTKGTDSPSQILVSESGVINIEPGVKIVGGGLQLLKLPVKANETWESVLEAPVNVTAKHKTIGEEEIEVPAGKFKAIKTELVYSMPAGVGFDVAMEYWYAPNIGMVKMAIKPNKAGLQQEHLLKSITTPKK